MQDYRRFRVWKLAYEFSLAIYRATKTFPADERFGLTAQLRRAAVSIQSNIAEGLGRATLRDTVRFLGMALGSTAEVRSHLQLALGLGYLASEAHAKLDDTIDHLRGMLFRLSRTLKAPASRVP